MSEAFEYVFPAIRGVQARREYYVSMCPLRLVTRILAYNEEELRPELRAQRVLNRARIPELARYILENRDDYVFSALTASIDGRVRFLPAPGTGENSHIGTLHVPMTAQFVINDGQHRRAAIDAALKDCPDLADESIAVVFFLDVGLARSQQMFADLNRHAVRPSRSIGILYDHRDLVAQLTRTVVTSSPVFRDVVEMERTTLALRSRKLFTLSAIYVATEELLTEREGRSPDELTQTATTYWEEVAQHFPEWQLVREGRMTAGEVRTDFIHSHGIVLHALGRVGNTLLLDPPWNPEARPPIDASIGANGEDSPAPSPARLRGRQRTRGAAQPVTQPPSKKPRRQVAADDSAHVAATSVSDFQGKAWRTVLARLRDINWARSNAALWEGRAMVGGRISKSHHHVTLTTNAIKQHLELPLNPDEQRIEDAFRRGDFARVE